MQTLLRAANSSHRTGQKQEPGRDLRAHYSDPSFRHDQQTSISHRFRVDGYFRPYLNFVKYQNPCALKLCVRGNFNLESFEKVFIKAALEANHAYVLSYRNDAWQRQKIITA